MDSNRCDHLQFLVVLNREGIELLEDMRLDLEPDMVTYIVVINDRDLAAL